MTSGAWGDRPRAKRGLAGGVTTQSLDRMIPHESGSNAAVDRRQESTRPPRVKLDMERTAVRQRAFPLPFREWVANFLESPANGATLAVPNFAAAGIL